MFNGLDEDWKRLLGRENRALLSAALNGVSAELRKAGLGAESLAPPPDLILNAFRLCPYSALKVVILAQNPYSGPRQAHGLAFSVPADVPVPPSLENIFACLKQYGLIERMPRHGDLSSWARQGVLLLTAALTTRIGHDAAHEQYWEEYTNKIIGDLCREKSGLIFILLGNFAKKKEGLIGEGHHVFTWTHPSPSNFVNRGDTLKHFKYCPAFFEANQLLGERAIKWELDAPYTVKERVAGPNDPAPPDDITYVFTDGGARGNGSSSCKASWAFYVTNGCNVAEAYGLVAPAKLGLKYQASNNRGELTAIEAALTYLASHLDTFGPECRVVTDSEYAIGCITKWYADWKAKPDVLAKKKNVDLISRCYDLVQKINAEARVTFEHVKGHAEEPQDEDSAEWFYWSCNDTVDRLCGLALGR